MNKDVFLLLVAGILDIVLLILGYSFLVSLAGWLVAISVAAAHAICTIYISQEDFY